MKKKYLSLVFLLMFCVSMVLPVCAAGSSRLDDNADYLTDSEETALLSKLNEISTRQGMDVVVVTIPALYGNDITASCFLQTIPSKKVTKKAMFLLTDSQKSGASQEAPLQTVEKPLFCVRQGRGLVWIGDK